MQSADRARCLLHTQRGTGWLSKMLARARLKLKNAESSISFIQEQHTRTLEGLHQEIQHLQQKNARLTFELAVQGTSASKSDTCKHAEEVQAYKSEANSLRTALTTCKEEIKFLKHKLMTVESNLSEEVAERDAQIGRLSAEVERRARIIAHLTKQLHQMKVEFTRFLEEASLVQSVGATVVPGQDHSGHQRTTVVEPPATAVGRIRRRTRRATSSATPHEPDVPHEKTAPRRSLPTPVTHSPPPPPSASPRPPSTSPPPRSRQRSSRLLRRAAQTATSTPERSPPLQRPSTNLDPVRIQKPAPDITEILRNNSVSSTPNLSRSVAPILPPIPTNPSLLGSQRNSASSARRLQEKEESRERRLLVKEELPHGKGHAWQELHQSGSD